MTYAVIITEPALLDLFHINDYYLTNVSDKTANKIIDDLETAVNSLNDFPERGSFPKELLNLGVRQYRQVIVKSYRIIYEVLAEQVIVHTVLDGRRDIKTLLSQRLFY
jgi:toxin ParE1/3/4